MLRRDTERLYHIFDAPDQCAGFAATRTSCDERRGGSLNSCLLKFIVLFLGRWAWMVFLLIASTVGNVYLLWFFRQSRQSVQHGGLRDTERIDKCVGRCALYQVQCTYSFEGHQQFSGEEIGGYLSLTAGIIAMADAERFLKLFLVEE